MEDLQKGDLVEVSFRGEVTRERDEDGDYRLVLDGQGEVVYINPDAESVTRFQKVEPPIETFVLGDRVRERDTKNEYTLGAGGYIAHSDGGRWFKHNYLFTSLVYELVNR